jgi:hypothetical protein
MARYLRVSLWVALATLAAGIRPAVAGPAATLERFFAALRANDRAALEATLAPDYRYDGQDRGEAANVFEGLLSLHYQALHARVESMARTREVVTASASLFFEGTVNLEAIQGGRPRVNGSGRLLLELSPRGGEWLLTAWRVVRAVYVAPGREAPHLFDVTLNGRTSLRVAPGANLSFAGKVYSAEHLFLFLGGSSLNGALDPEFVTQWRAPIAAPAEPGRYLAHAVAVSRDLQVLERFSIPVTVTAP